MQKIREIVLNANKVKYNEYIENALDEADKEAENPNTKYLTFDEVFEKIRRKLNE